MLPRNDSIDIDILSTKTWYYLDGTPIGIDPVLEQIFKELLVKSVDSVIKSQQDKLRRPLGFESARDLRSSAKAVR